MVGLGGVLGRTLGAPLDVNMVNKSDKRAKEVDFLNVTHSFHLGGLGAMRYSGNVIIRSHPNARGPLMTLKNELKGFKRIFIFLRVFKVMY